MYIRNGQSLYNEKKIVVNGLLCVKEDEQKFLTTYFVLSR